jgi:hypothetical protein
MAMKGTARNESGTRVPLLRCRACSSRLIQPVRIWFLVDGRRAVERRCPECERHDRVLVEPVVAAALMRRERRLRERFRSLVEALADERSYVEAPPR